MFLGASCSDEALDKKDSQARKETDVAGFSKLIGQHTRN
jgi:hypothetical protein